MTKQAETIASIRGTYAALREKVDAMPDDGMVLQWDNGLCFAQRSGCNIGLPFATVFADHAAPASLLRRGLRNGKDEAPVLRTVPEAKRVTLELLAQAEAMLDGIEEKADG